MDIGECIADGKGGLSVWDGRQFVPCECGACVSMREGFARLTPTAAPCPLTPSDVQRAATEGKNTERDRILARLNSIKPGEQPYTRIQSEWERRGAVRMWERMREAIVDGQGAHRDRDAA